MLHGFVQKAGEAPKKSKVVVTIVCALSATRSDDQDEDLLPGELGESVHTGDQPTLNC